jgi:peptide/nickel transport system substrate-binding protein
MHARALARIGAITGALLLLAAGCGGAGRATATGAATAPATAAASPAGGKTLTIGLGSAFQTLDPLLSGAYVDRQVFSGLYDSLVTLTPDGQFRPGLAKSWTISPDGLTYTFELQPNVKFQDGTDFDAQAMAFNLERAMNDKASPRYAAASFISTVTATGPLELQVKLKQPFAPFLSILVNRLGMPVSPAAVQKYGKDYPQHPVGTGAFMFKEYVKGDHLTLVRNPNYWQPGLPKVDTIVYKILPDANAALLDLKAGTVQVLDGAPPQQLASLQKDAAVVVSVSPGMSFNGFDYNATRPPFDNVWLRRAVDAAIDRPTLVRTIFGDAASPADGPFPPSSWAYDPSHQVPGADLAAAKADLAKGGQPDGFTFTFTTTNSPLSQQVAQVLQNMLQQAGITMKIQLIDSGAFTSIANAKNFQAIANFWSGRFDPDQNVYNWFHTGGAFNYGGYTSPAMDRLLEQARAAQSQDTRRQLYGQVATLARQDVPYEFLYFAKDIKVLLPSVTGFQHYPDGIFRVDALGLK